MERWTPFLSFFFRLPHLSDYPSDGKGIRIHRSAPFQWTWSYLRPAGAIRSPLITLFDSYQSISLFFTSLTALFPLLWLFFILTSNENYFSESLGGFELSGSINLAGFGTSIFPVPFFKPINRNNKLIDLLERYNCWQCTVLQSRESVKHGQGV